jgi:hypothetical protein
VTKRSRFGVVFLLALARLFQSLAITAIPAQQPDDSQVLRAIDTAVKARFDSIAGYTVTEHYAVFRNGDETHPDAEMTVKTTYRRDSGKTYAVLAQSGSQVIRSFVLGAILDNEKHINQPGVREGSWITSANYEMRLKPDAATQLDGHACLALDLFPKRKAPYLIEGTLWVDRQDGSIVQLQGKSSSPSLLTGRTEVERHYAKVNGFSQATHAMAVSNSVVFGRTVVKIDYTGYQVQLDAPK